MYAAMINQARAAKAAEEMLKAAAKQPVGYVTLSAVSGAALFVAHASTCRDIEKDAWKGASTPAGIFANLAELGDDIAANYGGYSDNGDAPTDLAHALSWVKFKACVAKAGLEVRS